MLDCLSITHFLSNWKESSWAPQLTEIIQTNFNSLKNHTYTTSVEHTYCELQEQDLLKRFSFWFETHTTLINIQGPSFKKKHVSVSTGSWNFFNVTNAVIECWLSILKQSYKLCGTNDNSLDLSVASEIMHTPENRHFPAGWLNIRQQNKKAAVQ